LQQIFIATVDVKKYIYHIACNKYDTQIAIVENQGHYENIDESVVRIYDVGRSRTEDETVSFFDYFGKHLIRIFIFIISDGRRR